MPASLFSTPVPHGPASLQVLVKGGDKFKYEQPNPFVSPDDDEELASCAYRWVHLSRHQGQPTWHMGSLCEKQTQVSLGLSHALCRCHG
jgi:hypothetical protein